MHTTRLARAIALTAILASAVSRPGHSQAGQKPRNLRVLPADLSRDSVVTIMRFVVASGLGVSCSFCHGAVGVPFDSIDYASDERQTKRTAREMMRMVARINDELLPAIPGRGTPPLTIQCITCHRGMPGASSMISASAPSTRWPGG
jgi:hypothetical protein